MLAWFKKWFSSEKPTLSLYQEAVLLLEGCQLKDYSVYADYTKVFVLRRTIYHYCDLITSAQAALEHDLTFYDQNPDARPASVPLADFFKSREGRYLPVTNTHRIFVDCAIDFIKTYERINDLESLTARQQQNLVKMYDIVTNLRDLAVTLNESTMN